MQKLEQQAEHEAAFCDPKKFSRLKDQCAPSCFIRALLELGVRVVRNGCGAGR